ncbi:MAG: hypothetical protein AAFN77_09530 [Planctomycetota bacterium]
MFPLVNCLSKLKTYAALIAICACGSFVSSQALAQTTPSKSTLTTKVQDNKKNNKPKSNSKKGTSQSSSVKPPPVSEVNTERKTPAPVSNQRISEIFDFLSKHHPEMRPILRTLQRNNAQQFQTAMRGLDRDVRSLQNQKTNSPDRYDRSLKIWVARSKTKLIAAKIATSSNEKQIESLKKKMEAMVNEHFELRKKQLEDDLAFYQKKAARVRKQISDLDQQHDREMKRQIDAMTRAAQRIKKNNKQRSKNQKSDPKKSDSKKATDKNSGAKKSSDK